MERTNPYISISELAQEFQLSANVIQKYLNMSEQEVNEYENRARKRRARKGEKFCNIIFKMMRDGYSDKVIYSYLRNVGITESSGTLMNYITMISLNNFPRRKRMDGRDAVKYRYPEEITVINRAEVLKYVLTISSTKRLSSDVLRYIPLIKEKYSIVEWVEDTWYKFHGIIMGKEPEKLDEFITEYKNTKLSGFCMGLRQDIVPIKNAIKYKISSGFVEGNNNKFKLIKRALYGRAKLNHLELKCLLTFRIKQKDLKISDLIAENYSNYSHHSRKASKMASFK